jgi:hypothetical protein
MRQPGQGVQGEERLARFARRPVATSEFYPELERFVRYDADPFAARSDRGGAAIASAPHPTPVGEASASAREAGPTIIALLGGGPLAGRRVEAEVGEGRPPKTIDVDADDGSTCRYCLVGWAQSARPPCTPSCTSSGHALCAESGPHRQ